MATYAYNPLMFWLQSQVVVDINSFLVQSNVYAYDLAGNIIRVDDKVKNTSKIYTYDELDRMITSNDGSGVISYSYDETGNIIKKGNLTYTYAQNGAGPHAVTAISDGTSMTYDVNGNMASYRSATKTQYFTYDTLNRLVKVEAVDAGAVSRYPVAEYSYDGDGGRTMKKVYNPAVPGAVTAVTYFVGELFEVTGSLKTDYIFLGGARVAAYDGTKVRWFIGDHLGSTSAVLDEASSLKERTEYTPWGEVKSYDNFGNTSEVAWYYFTGKRLDEESGLIYFGARYYMPKIGWFITPDTIVQSPYNPQTLNRYTYCNNNPITLVDPTGHSWKKFFASAVGAVIAVVATVITAGALGPAMIAAYGSFWGGVMVGAISGAVGGALGGATTGGILGGGAGALQGAMMGAAFGAVGGAIMGGVGGSSWTNFAKDVARNTMMIGSGAYSAATGNLDMFAGALVGGGIGYKMATGNNPSMWSSTSRGSSGRVVRTVDVRIDSVEAKEMATTKPNGGEMFDRVVKAVGGTAGVAEEYYKDVGAMRAARASLIVGGAAEIIDAVKVSNELTCYGVPRVQAALVHVGGILTTSAATSAGFVAGSYLGGPAGGVALGGASYVASSRLYDMYESAALEQYGCK